MKGLPAPHFGTLIFINNNFFLDTCLVISPKEQVPAFSGMTDHGMPFQQLLSLNMDTWLSPSLCCPVPTGSSQI